MLLLCNYEVSLLNPPLALPSSAATISPPSAVLVVVVIAREPLVLVVDLLLLLLDHLVLTLSSMAASPVALSAALNTWARGCALAARDIEHVHGRFLLLDGCGLASFRDLHLARDDRVELVVFVTSVRRILIWSPLVPSSPQCPPRN